MLPNFLIIGAQKSASTFLQVCLNDHPEIYLPTGEIPFFESPDYEDNNLSELEKLFENRNEKCLGIKRPNYLGKPEVPKRIESDLPNAKLIVVLRNPIDRAISAYYHNIKYGFIPPIDVEVGMRKIINKTSFSQQFQRSPEILEFGYYNKYLTLYKYFFKNDQILIFLHEDILSNPLESVKTAYRFLDISSDFIPESLYSRPQNVTYNLKRLKFMTLRNRFMFDYNLDHTRVSVKNKNIIDNLGAGIITMLDKKILAKFLDNSKPKVSLELRQLLYKKYSNDINSLEGLIGRDLSTWKLT